MGIYMLIVMEIVGGCEIFVIGVVILNLEVLDVMVDDGGMLICVVDMIILNVVIGFDDINFIF